MNSNSPFTIQPDWKVLNLTSNAVPGCAQASVQSASPSAKSTLLVAPDALPFIDKQFHLINCGGAFDVDLYALVKSCERVLKPGGWLVVHDLTVPEAPRAARYVNAFYQFRDPSQHTHYAEYEWRGAFLDVGLHIEKCTVSRGDRRNLFESNLNMSTYQIKRLPILLQQAPDAVAKFLQPFAVGSKDAMFNESVIQIYGQKPT